MQTTENTILITGGGSGIGRGLAEAFHALGNRVIITGRTEPKLRQTAEANPGMQWTTLDVADPTDVQRFADDVTERFPDLNVVINNAGIMQMEDLTEPDRSAALATVTTNLMGPIWVTAALLPHLLAQPRAAVMNVTSGLAFVPMAATATYCATKAALHSYTISLREQLRDSSVQVLEIAPPYVQTHLTGEAQANDPRAMPLDEYIADTMQILTQQPQTSEVIIDRVAPLRHAEKNGNFDQIHAQLSAMGRERHAAAKG